MNVLVFIVPCYASVKEKTEIKNMKTNNHHNEVENQLIIQTTFGVVFLPPGMIFSYKGRQNLNQVNILKKKMNWHFRIQ